jgi:beta-lactamase regulating signal transducer with metallopeptidase domain
MSGPAELSIACGVLLDAGLKATLVLVLAAAGCRALRGSSAAARHATWAAGLACLPALPWLALQRGPEIAVDAPWVVAVWAAGALLAALPLVMGLLKLVWLRATAETGPAGHHYSPHIHGPLTWGLLRPIVVLPTAARGWSPSRLAAALAHERAHVRRADWAVHVAAWAVSALFWFHPLVWFARHRLAHEAEHAADDAVLAQGIRPSDYARLLVSMSRVGTPRVALGMGASLVGRRVHAVLEPGPRSTRRWPVLVVALVGAGLALPSLAAWPTWTAPPEALTCRPERSP